LRMPVAVTLVNANSGPNYVLAALLRDATCVPPVHGRGQSLFSFVLCRRRRRRLPFYYRRPGQQHVVASRPISAWHDVALPQFVSFVAVNLRHSSIKWLKRAIVGPTTQATHHEVYMLII